MKYKVKAFGITKDIMGGREIEVDLNAATVGGLREYLDAQYPPLKQLKSLFIAVNQSYADDDQQLVETDEIALIPPVSGG